MHPAMRSQFVTASKRNVRHRPLAFTEHGALMAANVLRSGRAVEMSVFVIRAFVRAREQLAANAAILKRLLCITNGSSRSSTMTTEPPRSANSSPSISLSIPARPARVERAGRAVPAFDFSFLLSISCFAPSLF